MHINKTLGTIKGTVGHDKGMILGTLGTIGHNLVIHRTRYGTKRGTIFGGATQGTIDLVCYARSEDFLPIHRFFFCSCYLLFNLISF